MTKLRKELTLYGLTLIAVGSCVGSGIFLTPHEIAQHLPSEGHMLLVWTLGGFISLTGALTFAELGGLFPKTGGVYQFIKEAYGELYGFLYGWCILLVITSGAIAALSVAFASYLNYFLEWGETGQKLLAISCISLITVANIFGVKISQFVSSTLTMTKIIGIAGLVIVAVVFCREGFAAPFQIREIDDPQKSFSLALIGVLWSYGGWHHASYLAGESKEAARIVPKAMMLGTLIVTLIYLTCNAAYLWLMPLDDMLANEAVATIAMTKVVEWGAPVITILIAVSVIGTASIYTLTAPRIYYRMARDGVFFSIFGRIHKKYGVPVWAIVLQSAWAIVLLLFWSTFSNLIGYVVFTDWIFMLLAGMSIFLFRKRLAHRNRPYKAFLYPVTPIIFGLIVIWFIVSVLMQEPLQAWAGLLLMAVGIPVFYIFLLRRGKKSSRELLDNN
jgi:basic amino acid/polyamine antiporter, APA family